MTGRTLLLLPRSGQLAKRMERCLGSRGPLDAHYLRSELHDPHHALNDYGMCIRATVVLASASRYAQTLPYVLSVCLDECTCHVGPSVDGARGDGWTVLLNNCAKRK